jgi:hypothetical protein
MPRSPEQTCESNISSSKLDGVSETVANPANPRPPTAIATPRTDTSSPNTTGEEELPPASISGLDVPLDAGVVAGWVGRLAEFQREVTDAERIDQIRALERLKSAAAAAQARPHTVDITTPTGHTYRSTAPAAPGSPRSARDVRRVPTSGPASPRPPAAGSRGARRGSRAWSALIRPTVE